MLAVRVTGMATNDREGESTRLVGGENCQLSAKVLSTSRSERGRLFTTHDARNKGWIM